MGFFKDAKDAITGAKELGDYHGGMPSIRGSFKDIAALTDDRGQGEILKHGAPGQGAWSTASRCSTEKFTMQIELEVLPARGRRAVHGRLPVPDRTQKTPLSVGMDVPVKIIRRRPDGGRGAVGRAEGRDRRGGRRHERRDAGHPEHLRRHRRRRGASVPRRQGRRRCGSSGDRRRRTTRPSD